MKRILVFLFISAVSCFSMHENPSRKRPRQENTAARAALNEAVRDNLPDDAQTAIEEGARVTRNQLRYAITKRYVRMVKLLLENSSHPSYPNTTLKKESNETVLQALARVSNESHHAAHDIDMIVLLLENGATLEAQSTTAIQLMRKAITWDIGKLARLLIKKHKVSPNMLDNLGPDESGTPINDSFLHTAAMQNAHRVLTVLLEFEGNSNIQDISGATPLLNAIVFGNQETAMILLANGAEVNFTDDLHPHLVMNIYNSSIDNQKTFELMRALYLYGLKGEDESTLQLFRDPFEIACLRGDIDEVQRNIPTTDTAHLINLTDALALATGQGHIEIVELLLKKGANHLNALEVIGGILRRPIITHNAALGAMTRKLRSRYEEIAHMLINRHVGEYVAALPRRERGEHTRKPQFPPAFEAGYFYPPTFSNL